MTALRKYGILPVILALLAGCSGRSETCLDLFEGPASADRLRHAQAPEAVGGHALCEGLANLREGKLEPARTLLQAAKERAAPSQRWSAQGFLGMTQARSGMAEPALKNLREAIEAARRAQHVARETFFRASRGSFLEKAKRFDQAHADFAEVYRISDNVGVKAEMAYNAFATAVSAERLDEVKRWYRLTMAASRVVGAADKMAYATELYGQLLDKRQDFAASDAVYRLGTAQVARTGDRAALADVTEFHGQSRFAAGDYDRGKTIYARSAEHWGEAGHAKYAGYLERNGRAFAGPFERGYRCEDLVTQGHPSDAVNAVEQVPDEKRSFGARLCLVRALSADGKSARAHGAFDELLADTVAGGWQCDEMREVSRQMGPRTGAKARATDRSVRSACDMRP